MRGALEGDCAWSSSTTTATHATSLATVLGQRNAEVYAAACAADALVLVQRERPDVLISDIAMPEEDGYLLIAAHSRAPGRARRGDPRDCRHRLRRTRRPQARARRRLRRAPHKPVDFDALVARDPTVASGPRLRVPRRRRDSRHRFASVERVRARSRSPRRRGRRPSPSPRARPASSHSRASSLRGHRSSICPHIRYIASSRASASGAW